jgi:hypothetical protein
MKYKKILIVVIVLALLCSFGAIAYSDDDEHPWYRGLILWRLRTDINDNKMRIDALEEAVNELGSLYGYIEGMQIQIDELQAQIDEIMAMLEPGEPVQEAVVVEADGYFTYDGVDYYISQVRIAYITDSLAPSSQKGSHNYEMLFASSGMSLVDYSGVGDPEGWGDGVWFDIYSPSETLAPGDYYYEPEMVGQDWNPNWMDPNTFGQLFLVIGYDYEQGLGDFYTANGGTITVVDMGDTFIVEFSVDIEGGNGATGTFTIPSF